MTDNSRTPSRSPRETPGEDLRRSREELRGLAAKLEAVREEERKAIAREIHDELGQALTVLRLELHWTRGLLPAGAESLHERFDSMTEVLDRTLSDVRALATRLRPSLLDDLGLEAAVEWQAEDFKRRTGIEVHLERDLGDLPPDGERDTLVFRILQEALTNVARHAGAKGVEIRLYLKDKDELRMTVRDDGCGITREEIRSTGSLGIVGMRERAGGLGGLLLVRPQEAGGTEVSLSIPVDPGGRAKTP